MKSTSTGGYCLGFGAHAFIRGVAGKRGYPRGHVSASARVVSALSDLIRSEGIRSISDFGAGVGQYKAAVLSRSSDLRYAAYDGAGDILESTDGYVEFFDLTLPLALPKTDWVMSLEVGEHVPNMYEAMVIRNLHHHNCKGLILSWAVLGQLGRNHINCHSNKYIISVFEELGYTYDNTAAASFRLKEDNYWWFEKSLMVFRRKTPAC